MRLIMICFCLISSLCSGAQTELDSILNASLEDQEIEEVVVIYRDPASLAKLRRDVLKAYPYALRASSIVEQIQEQSSTIKKKRHKKKYIKKKEKELKEEFEDNLRKLTKTQGRYMVRLINRETDETVYNLIKEYKNGANAVFWQFIAKKFDSDLKSTFQADDVNHIDYEIEQIVSALPEAYIHAIKNQIEIDAPTYRDFQ